MEDGCSADARADSNYCDRHKRTRLVTGLQAAAGIGGVAGVGGVIGAIGAAIGGIAGKNASDKDDADKK
jgi:hypothetical protein